MTLWSECPLLLAKPHQAHIFAKLKDTVRRALTDRHSETSALVQYLDSHRVANRKDETYVEIEQRSERCKEKVWTIHLRERTGAWNTNKTHGALLPCSAAAGHHRFHRCSIIVEFVLKEIV
tara:strand:+ start:317 stop:679 length:363 start_codon:yes stop_codon:yes gene_type:complete